MPNTMLSSQKHLFNLDPTVHYLNCAAYGPLLKTSVEAGYKGIQQKAHPYELNADLHFSGAVRVQKQVAQLINCPDHERIAIVSSVSYGLAIVAANLCRVKNIQQKTKIISLENEFPNDFYAFERVNKELNLHHQIIEQPSEIATMGTVWNKRILEAIDAQTALVVLPHVHWIYGVVFDLKTISQRCKETGALLVIDGTQSVGALPFSLQEIEADAVICGAYKWLLGPYTLGFAYFSDFFDDGIPLEETWMNRLDSHNFAGLTTYQSSYRPKAQRYNMGEFSQFIQLPMLEASLQQILEWGIDSVQNYAKNLSAIAIEELQKIGCKTVETAFRAGHLFGLILPENTDKQQLSILLNEQKIMVSNRGAGLRIATHVFNTEQDIQELIKVIKTATNQ